MTRIVVVDDDPTNTTLIQMLLELDGFVVETSADLDRARKTIDGSTEAFLIDCHLARGVSGLDLVRDIRMGNTSASYDSVVVVTSGDYRQENEATDAGADLFLLKPYKPDELSGMLYRLLDEKGKHAQ